MEKLFRTVETDAILFATNYLAISGLKVLKQTGQKIGKNLSVMAYDDHEVFELHTPGISAIQQPLEEIAEAIIQLILRQLSSKTKLDNQQIIFPAKIVQR